MRSRLIPELAVGHWMSLNQVEETMREIGALAVYPSSVSDLPLFIMVVDILSLAVKKCRLSQPELSADGGVFLDRVCHWRASVSAPRYLQK